MKIAFILLQSTVLVRATGWTYSDQAHWDGECQTGQSQSPIDIDVCDNQLDCDNVEADKFSFSPEWSMPQNCTITNNGHTIMLTPESSEIRLLYRGFFYFLSQIHCHWGSEHTINGVRADLECHCVNIQYANNTDAEDFDEAFGYRILVLATRFDIYDSSSGILPADQDKREVMASITEAIPSVEEADSTYGPVELHPRSLFPDFPSKFYTYSGSLTTPPCTEPVFWCVPETRGFITQEQSDSFRTIKDHDGEIVTANYRDTQPLNGRVIAERNMDGIFY